MATDIINPTLHQGMELSAEEEHGFRVGIGFFALTFLAVFGVMVLYVVDLRLAAAVVAGLWAIVVVAVSPRAGIALAFGIQIADILLNPDQEGEHAWVSPGRVLPLMIIASYVRLRISRRPDLRAVRGPLFLWGAFLAFAALSISWATYRDVAAWAVLKLLIHFLLVPIAADVLSDRKVLQQSLLIMVVGGGIGAVMALAGVGVLRGESAHRLALVGVGVNALAISLGNCLAAGFALLLLRRTPSVVIITLCSAVVMSLVALRTGTRSVFLGLPLAVVIGASIGYWHRLHKLMVIGCILLAVGGGAFLWAARTGFIYGDLQERLLGVFEADTFEENVRWNLWQDGLDIAFSRPLGTGAANEAIAYANTGALSNGALESHNTLLSVLIQYNIVGLLLFTSALVYVVVSIFRMKERAFRAAAAIILFFCIISAMKGTLHPTRQFWQPMCILCAMIVIERRDQSNTLDTQEVFD